MRITRNAFCFWTCMAFIALFLSIPIVSCKKKQIKRKVEKISERAFMHGLKRLVYYEEEGLDLTNWALDTLLECDSVHFYFSQPGNNSIQLTYLCDQPGWDTLHTRGYGSYDITLADPDSTPLVRMELSVLNFYNSNHSIDYMNLKLVDIPLTWYDNSGFTLEGKDRGDGVIKKVRFKTWGHD